MKTLLLVVALATIWTCTTDAKVIPNPLFRTKEPPVPVRSRDASERAVEVEWIDVPLDQFNENDTRSFAMRYMTNDQFFVEDGAPVFILLGGEWSINAGWLLGGHMYQIARDVGGYMMYTEHRYYGLSWPANTTETENLEFLIVDQALADVIDVIDFLKSQPRFANSKIIVFGGSYAANMATWIRDKYPDHIDGALASSGPVVAKADFFEYLETVSDALLKYGGEECIAAIRNGVEHSRQAIVAGDIEPVQEAYNLCSPLNHTNPLDVQTFFSYITGSFSGSVQYGTPTSLQNVCNQLLSIEGSDMQILGRYINNYYGGGCYDTIYDEVIEYYLDTSMSNENTYTTRLWIYQTCTEYGYYQTTNSTNQPFGATLPVSYYADNLCAGFFGPEFDAELLDAGIERTNRVYEGLTPNVTKVFSVHGTIDPWHRLGIMEDLNDESPTFVIEDSAHCVDLQAPNINDVPGLTEARALIRAAVMEWIAA